LRGESGSGKPKNYSESETEHSYSFHTKFDLFDAEAFKHKVKS